MTTRVFSPSSASAAAVVMPRGVSYKAAPGTVLDVPDHDATILGSNGWTVVASSGATANRPTHPQAGVEFFDTTVGKIIKYDGANWRDPATGGSV